MAIHLILLVVNEVEHNLMGHIHIYSDCLGVLNMVKNLLPSRVPTPDVLKNILVNCRDLSFDLLYSQVLAHQDNHSNLMSLSRPPLLNCAMDSLAKRAIWELQTMELPVQQAFPLKQICVFAGQMKLTADTDTYLPFWAHRQLAKVTFHSLGILFAQEFDYVDWEMVHDTLRKVPQLFQVWACKQVMGIAGTMEWDNSTV